MMARLVRRCPTAGRALPDRPTTARDGTIDFPEGIERREMADTPGMHIDAMARLQMLRGMFPSLIDSHPEPAKALSIVADYQKQLRAILGATTPGSDGHRKAAEGLAEIEVLIGRLQRARDLNSSAADQRSQTRTTGSVEVRRNTPDLERD